LTPRPAARPGRRGGRNTPWGLSVGADDREAPLALPSGYVRGRLREDREGRLHHLGVEGLARLLAHVAARLLRRPGGSVGALGGEGVVDVGDGEDACQQRDLRAHEAVGVALAVPALVMVADHLELGPRHAQGAAY